MHPGNPAGSPMSPLSLTSSGTGCHFHFPSANHQWFAYSAAHHYWKPRKRQPAPDDLPCHLRCRIPWNLLECTMWVSRRQWATEFTIVAQARIQEVQGGIPLKQYFKKKCLIVREMESRSVLSESRWERRRSVLMKVAYDCACARMWDLIVVRV